MTSFFGGLTAAVEIDIKLDLKENHKYFKMKNAKGEKVKLPVFTKNDDISGTIAVQLKDCKKYEHLGIKCNLIGYLGMCCHTQRYSLVRICQLSSTVFLRSWSQLVYSWRIRVINSSSRISRKSMRHLMGLQDGCVTLSV